MTKINEKETKNKRDIINGALLTEFAERKVSIIGSIVNAAPNGLTFEMRTTDDVLLKVILKKPYKDLLEGYIEVHGLVQKNVIACDDFVLFPIEKNENFDVAAYNQLCNRLHTIPYLWKTN
ncbi:uncharacterized protein LOC108733138 [Agrilus planipennis]|uniref:Uncharacterized protein LOC108733138 n=1 Tax=Agrilus planipennis TaxID=224129 RepID=A0A1W4W6F9_AGRPL|nr:uncharacterized protein LOC108733138 [Agrilus planipennis]